MSTVDVLRIGEAFFRDGAPIDIEMRSVSVVAPALDFFGASMKSFSVDIFRFQGKHIAGVTLTVIKWIPGISG